MMDDWGAAEAWHFRFGGTKVGQILELLWALVMAAGWILVLVEGATLLGAIGRSTLVWSHEQDPRLLIPTIAFVAVLVVLHPRVRGTR